MKKKTAKINKFKIFKVLYFAQKRLKSGKILHSYAF